MRIIRSDTFRLEACPEGRQALGGLLDQYRCLVRDLMTVINTHWPVLGALEGHRIIQSTEALMHPTSKRPVVKYGYFHRRYYKFPSYLRRAAIADAAGQVRSFHSRYNRWLDGERRRGDEKPPKLTCATSTFPSLYRGQCVRFSDDGRTAWIKVYWQRDWIWRAYRLTGKARFAGQGRAMSPLLKCKRGCWSLSVPIEIDIERRAEPPGRVLAIDVGMNTTAAGAIVDVDGTVHARFFERRSDSDREHRLMARIRARARVAGRHGGRLQRGFCQATYRQLRHLADDQAHQISRRIVNRAIAGDCQAIVLEQLKGFRPTGGKRRSHLKARFHRWYHRMLTERIEAKAAEAGIRTIQVWPRGTSAQAFDGSGKVRRDRTNASLCVFPSGKRYNTDLNAAYNIAARGIIYLTQPGRRKSAGGASGQKSPAAPRSPVTLSSLWANQALKQAG
jgi:IS605 OrfB family transposase